MRGLIEKDGLLGAVTMKREVKEELLDVLPYDDPEALRSRRDLRLINALMGNYRRMIAISRQLCQPGDRLLELGAGRGELSSRLRRSLPQNIQIDALDLCPEPEDWPSESKWYREDLTEFTEYHRYQGVLANLILHQFSDAQLSRLGKRLSADLRIIIATEPSRRRRHLAQLKSLGLFAFGRVTRHDGAISVRAGFRGDELPHLLGLDSRRWRWQCEENFFGQYFMRAERID